MPAQSSVAAAAAAADPPSGHNRIVPSRDAEKICRSSSSSDVTGPVCPTKLRVHRPDRVSHTRTLRSTDDDANTVSSVGLQAMSSTDAAWPVRGAASTAHRPTTRRITSSGATAKSGARHCVLQFIYIDAASCAARALVGRAARVVGAGRAVRVVGATRVFGAARVVGASRVVGAPPSSTGTVVVMCPVPPVDATGVLARCVRNPSRSPRFSSL